MKKQKVDLIVLDMNIYLSSLNFLPISKGQQMCLKSPAPKEKQKTFPKLSGKLMWLEDATLPQASPLAWTMQQRLPSLVVEGIITPPVFYSTRKI